VIDQEPNAVLRETTDGRDISAGGLVEDRLFVVDRADDNVDATVVQPLAEIWSHEDDFFF
jgi:hypothetical protein